MQAPYYYHKLLDFDVEKWALGAGNSEVCDFFNRRKSRFEFNNDAALMAAVHHSGNRRASDLSPDGLASPASAYPRVPTGIEMAPTSYGGASAAAGACVVAVQEQQQFPMPASGSGSGGFPVPAGGGGFHALAGGGAFPAPASGGGFPAPVPVPNGRGGFPVPAGGGGRSFPVPGYVTGTVRTAHSYNA